MKLGMFVFMASVVIVSLAGISTSSVPPKAGSGPGSRQESHDIVDELGGDKSSLSGNIETAGVKAKKNNDDEMGAKDKGGAPGGGGRKDGSSENKKGKSGASGSKGDEGSSSGGKGGKGGSSEDKKGKGTPSGVEGKNFAPGKPYQTLKTTIILAATEVSTVYLNGVAIGGTKHWDTFATLKVYVGLGDVIGIVAKNSEGWHGMIADIKVGNAGRFMTGKTGFKTMVADEVGGDRDYWMLPGYKMCTWKTPVAVQRPNDNRFCRGFPYENGMKYVWAPNAPMYGSVYLRFVVGGEICLPSPSPVPVASTPGQDDCTCREVDGSGTGDCYEFTNPKFYDTFDKKKSCKRRDCSATYECVETGGTHRCMLRFATSEVRISDAAFSGKCIQVTINPAKPFYVPYAEL